MGGASVANYDWATKLATVTEGNVGTVLVNLGVNPSVCLAPPTDEATWKVDYQEGIDAIVAKWPLAHVFLAKPWASWSGVDCDATYDTLAGWIDDLVAANPQCKVGLDERDTGADQGIEGADNGATLTTDGVHYSAAGDTFVTGHWQTILGY